MNESIFKNVREAEEHAAYQVACFWLQSAHRILARGEIPVKLSKCSLTLSQSEIDRGIYHPFNTRARARMQSFRIAPAAIQLALAKLRDGQFSKVSKHFGVSLDSDAARLQAHILQNTGEREADAPRPGRYLPAGHPAKGE